jgi:Flp pilus assembly protein TadB
MFDHTRQRQPHRSRPHTCNATVSVLLAVVVPAVIWAVSHPLATALVAVAAMAAALGVRTLRARIVDRSVVTPSALASGP